ELQVILKDFEFVRDQMHSRMATISGLVTTNAQFLLAAIGLVLAHQALINVSAFPVLLIMPPLFLVFALLLMREDLLMLQHDKYFHNQIRKQLVTILGVDNTSLLTFISSMRGLKMGNVVCRLMSGCRYTFSFVGAVGVLIAYLPLHKNAFSLWAPWEQFVY